MQNDKLLPCPFCSIELIPFEKQKGYLKRYRLHPNNDCILSAFTIDLKDTKKVQLWNTRKPMERIVQQLEEKSNDIPIQYERNYEKGFGDGIDYAIDIVRNGGKE